MWGRWRKHLWPVVIGLVALLPFVWTLNDPFVSDDWNFLWLADTRGFSLSEIARTNTEGGEVGGSYRPVVSAFWRGMYQVAGTQPLPYRVATIGFHVANVLMLYYLLKKIFAQRQIHPVIAGISALLFAITPSKAEIAWVSVVNDTLATLFILLSCWAYIAALGKQGWKKFVTFGLSVVLGLLALLTKEFAIIIPVLIITLASVYGQKPKIIIWHGALFVGIVLSFFALRYAAIQLLASDYTGRLSLSTYQIWRAYCSYTIAFFVSGFPRAWITARWLDHVWLGSAVLAMGASITIWILRQTRLVFLGATVAVLYLLAIVPTVRFSIENSLRYASDEGERFVYFPSIFLGVLVAAIVWSLYQTANRDKFKKPIVILGLAVLVGAYGTLGFKTWRWHEAAQLAGNLVEQGESLISTSQYNGYVVVGLPEQWHGAQIFRNAYPLALALSLPGSDVPTKHLIASRLHTLYRSGAAPFTLTKTSAREFTYHNPEFLINTPSDFVSTDYTLANSGIIREKYGISVPSLTTSTVLLFSSQFVQTNQNQSIAILYFNGSELAVEAL